MITLEIRLDKQLGLSPYDFVCLVLEESVLTLLFTIENAAPKEPCNRT
jgi:hypothetical protein